MKKILDLSNAGPVKLALIVIIFYALIFLITFLNQN